MNQTNSKHHLSHIICCLTLLLSVIVLGWVMISSGQINYAILIAQILIAIVLIIRTVVLFKNTAPQENNRFSQQDFATSDRLLNSLSDGIIVINNQGIIQFFNKQASLITGFSAQEAMDISYQIVLKFVSQENTPLNLDHNPIETSRRTYATNQIDLIKIKTHSDKIIPIAMHIAPISDESNDLLIAFRDISRELDKEREQLEFISTASHEMRTPIATINGYLGLALNPKISQVDDKARDYIGKAQASVEHLGELFKNLLSISKAEDKSLIITPQVINLIDFVNRICNDFQPQLQQSNVNLVFLPTTSRSKLLNPDILVHTDKNLLHEVVSNLIENAIKYTPQGTVTVNVVIKEGDLAQISISDTGIGIPPEDIPHLFQKFYRVDNSETREIGGTGLGLYLCRKIIEHLHGRIWAESALGKGSTFYVELSRIDQARATQLQAHDARQIPTVAPSTAPQAHTDTSQTVSQPTPQDPAQS